MQVNSNGLLSFGNRGFTDYRARPFPFESPPLIAPFWDDFNPSRGGMIYYRQTNDSDQLELFLNYTSLLGGDEVENDYNPTHLFVATWDRVPPFVRSEVYICEYFIHNIGCMCILCMLLICTLAVINGC